MDRHSQLILYCFLCVTVLYIGTLAQMYRTAQLSTVLIFVYQNSEPVIRLADISRPDIGIFHSVG